MAVLLSSSFQKKIGAETTYGPIQPSNSYAAKMNV